MDIALDGQHGGVFEGNETNGYIDYMQNEKLSNKIEIFFEEYG